MKKCPRMSYRRRVIIILEEQIQSFSLTKFLERHRQKWRCFFCAEKRFDYMYEELAKIMSMLMVIHNENMSMFRLFLKPEQADKITNAYKKQFEAILNIDFNKENSDKE